MSRTIPAVVLSLIFATAAFASSRVRFDEGARSRQTRLATHSNNTCAVLDDGTVRCWGNNSQGQVGDGTFSTPKSTPVKVSGLFNAVSVAVGSDHACAIIANGAVMCWGGNSFGQLGNGSLTGSPTPVQVDGLDKVLAIAAGGQFTCAVRIDGAVWCWGRNDLYQLADPTPGYYNDLPQLADVGGTAVAITAGGSHACALVIGGTVRCWGSNFKGQLGDGTTTARSSGVAVIGGSSMVDIAAGSSHTCGLRAAGTVKCWGNNDSGQIGDGTQTQKLNSVTVLDHFISGTTPVALAGATAISAGQGHSCAILADGSVRCWGDQSHGELGDGVVGATVRTVASVEVSSLGNALDVAAGAEHTCAIEVLNGITRCWGDNSSGQIGNASMVLTSVPKEAIGVAGSIGAREVRTGNFRTCARRGTDAVACWGFVGAQLSNGTYVSSSPASALISTTPPTLPTDAIQLGMGGSATHECAVLSGGTAICWGYNDFGQLGGGFVTTGSNPIFPPVVPFPITVANLSSITGIATGQGYDYRGNTGGGISHTCALLADATARCWGGNASGELGDGTTTDSSTPVTVITTTGTTLGGIVMISAGGNYSCALVVNGDVYCWGDDRFGQLGNGQSGTSFSSSRAAKVSGLSDAIAISAGNDSACALIAGGSVECWGNMGVTARAEVVATATPISGLTDSVSISVGASTWCTVRAEGSAQCWGDNASNQLAVAINGDYQHGGYRTEPASVIGHFATTQGLTIPMKLGFITQIAAGAFHTCSLHSGGGVKCWGDNSYGQIGNGTFTSTIVPFVYQPTTANSFTANVSPKVVLASSGRIANVTALINCEAGQAHIYLSIVQGNVSGSGASTVQCAGGMIQVPMTIPAQGPNGFQPGSATANVEAIVKDKGVEVEDQHWTRAVTISLQP